MLISRLLCLAVCLYAVNAAARNDAATDLAGFLPGVQYVYTYSSTADVYQDVTLTSTAQITLQSLSSPVRTELRLIVSDESLTWQTRSGTFTDRTEPLGDLSRWFSATIGEDGTIASVSLPSDEKSGISAFKKSLVQLLALSREGNVERVVTSSGGLEVTVTTVGDKNTEKILTFDDSRILISVVSDEQLSSTREDLLGYPVHSHSELTLLNKVAVGQDAIQRPTGLVSEPILIDNVLDYVPLSEIEDALSTLLTSCSLAEDTHSCIRQLVGSLKLLQSDDLLTFVERKLIGSREFRLDEAMILIDALSYLEAGNFSRALTQLIDDSLSQFSEELTSKILFHLTSGRLLPDRAIVEAVSRLAFGDEDIPGDLHQKALLTLGGMAKHLRNKHGNLSDSIVERLHSALRQYSTSPEPERLRRSTDHLSPSISGSSLHSVLIDSIGNARALQSQSLLVEHVTGSHGNLAAKHAAVKALQGYDTEESAQALLDVVEGNPHPSVQHRAARAYQSHTRRRRDVSHIIHATSHHRSRRQVAESDVTISNVTMPAVTWRQEFGEPNITIGVSRALLNSYDIDTAPSSSLYTFSLHDETSFDSSLLLSSGEQHSEMLRTEICLQGTATYDVNILTDFTYNLTAHQFNRFSTAVPPLQQAFQDAYQQMVASDSGYSGLQAAIQQTIDALPSRFIMVEQLLEEFGSSLEELGSDFVLKQEAENILSDINGTFTESRDMAVNSLQALSSALNDLLPSRPPALISALIIDRLPFIDSPFYVQYLPYAPQKALANIFSVYRRTQAVFNDLEASYRAFDLLSSPHGTNYPWLSTAIYLRTAESSISSLLDQLVEAIDTADKAPSRNYDGASLSQFVELRSAVTSSLQPGLQSLKDVGNNLFSASQRLGDAFSGTQSAFQAFTQAYEGARSTVDTIFGQRFHPDFPRLLRSCDPSGDLGCGMYPTTSGDQYQPGIDVEVDLGNQILSPVSASVRLFDIGAIPMEAQPLYANYSASSSVIIFPEESSFNGIYFILSNIVPASSLTVQLQFYQSGNPIATGASTSQVPSGKTFVHIEAYKMLNGQFFSLDPTQFLQPDLNVSVIVQLECNDIVTYVEGMVVERRNVLSSTDVTRTQVGDPLVEGIPGHEFPQPYDIVIESSDSITSGTTPVQFFQSRTFIMVGQIPVQFEFSSVGNYQLNYSLSANFLSKTLELPVTPYFHARAEGLMRVGSTVFALVETRGTLLEILLPLTLEQNFSQWPLLASSNMDIVLVPSEFNLTTQLVQRTGAGQFAEQEVLQSDTVWQYSIPPLNNDEFYYQGALTDATPPLFIPLLYAPTANCYVRQLPDRSYNNPAFEIEFEAVDDQSTLNFSYSVGTYLNGENVLRRTEIGGKRLVVPHYLLPEEELYFTIIARNLGDVESVANCLLPDGVYYDRSPPFARINPIRSASSHPSQIEALIVLFDEYGFDAPQEIAIGLVPGERGSSVMPWMPFDVTSINSPPSTGDALDLFSFGRRGRFFENILETYNSVENVTDCATLCNDQEGCLSFDYSQEQRICILHNNIEGPEASTMAIENIFETLSLQTSRSYYHYEKLGAGNSTVVTYSGLNFEHNRVYYINMRLRNRLGHSNIVSSSGFLIDFTPPMPGKIRNGENDSTFADGCEASTVTPGCIEYSNGQPNHRIIVDGPDSGTVFNGPIPLLDAMYTSATNYITANWNGFSDSESGIYAYTWCIGTSLGSCDVLNQTDPHAHFGLSNRQAWTNAGLASPLDLSDGPYYISVQAISNVEYGGPLVTTVQHSTPYIIDTSPPILTEVESIDYDVLTNELSLNYSASDNGSGIATVSLALGRTQYDTSLLSWIPIESSGTAAVMVYIPDGIETWIKLRARNNAGLLTIAVSEEAITVDRSPPLAGTVNDGAEVGIDTDYTDSTSELCVNWEGFSDPESGISAIQWAIGRTPGGSSVYPATDLTPSEISESRACASSLTLIYNTTYYSTLFVYNGAMNMQSTTVTSDGVRVDVSPPVSGVVYDGPVGNIDQSYSSSLTTVEANWNGFYDYESSIAQYTIAVYRRPVGAPTPDAIYLTVVEGNINQISISQFSFNNGDQISVTVEARNGAGLTSTVTSNGYVIDLTPPQVSYIIDGQGLAGARDDLEYQASNTTYDVSWEVRDEESGITQIEGAIFEVREGRRMKVYPSSPLQSTTVSITPSPQSTWSIDSSELSLETGVRYIASLTFTNGAGLRVVYETNGVIVDPTPPSVQSVFVSTSTYIGEQGADMITVVADPDSIQVQWMAGDPESGISGYRVGIIDSNDSLVVDYIRFGNTYGGAIEGAGSMLSPNETYRVAVIAVNLAGEESMPVYSNQFRLSAGDSAGTVIDGERSTISEDTDYTDEITAVTAHFFGFESEICGGISSYEWALGEGSQGRQRESVMPFTTRGIVAVGTSGDGYAQASLPNLRLFGSRRLYVTVRGITGCGDILESTSNGFVIDSVPPSLEIIETGPQAIENAQIINGDSPASSVYQVEAGYSSIWRADDAQSGLSNQTLVDIGTYPYGSDISGAMAVSENYIRSQIMSADGVATYVTVTVTNGVGIESKRTSSPIIRDTTPPTVGELTCKAKGYPEPIKLWPVDLQRDNIGFISCSWSGIRDNQSGIAPFAVSIGTSPADQSVLSRVAIEGKEHIDSYSSPLMVFEQDTPYFLMLYITNGAGLEKIFTSDPIYFDATSPQFSGKVSVLRNFRSGEYSLGDIIVGNVGTESATCLFDTDIVSIVFQPPTDRESNTTFWYKFGVGYSPGNDDILTFQPISPSLLTAEDVSGDYLHYQIHPINFTNAQRQGIFFSIQVYNCHELYSVLASNPVYIKSYLTLENSWIFDGNDSSRDTEYQVSTTKISAYSHVGVNCPIRSAQWAVESVDGMLAQDYIEVELSSSTDPLDLSSRNTFFLNSDQVTLYSDESYRVLFQAVDYSGETFILRSNGFTVTTSAVRPGLVRDGSIPGQDLNYQEPANVLWAHWSGFGDGSPEQEITFYEVAAGSDREYPSTRTDIAPFTNVGLNTSHAFYNLDLVPESITYYITVRAHTVSGAYIDATSNGISVGYRRGIIPGEITLNKYQSDTTRVSLYWTEFESDLPIRLYEWALGTRSFTERELEMFCEDTESNFTDYFEVFGFTGMNLDTTATATELNLQHNSTYYVTLRVIDQAKKCRAVLSPNGVTVDTTRPIPNPSPRSIILGPPQSRETVPENETYVVYVQREQLIDVTWDDFQDPESGIGSYEVGIFQQSGGCDNNNETTLILVREFVEAGLERQVSFGNLELEEGQSYVAVVRATNRAGLKSDGYSQPVVVDSIAPIAGTVKDGTDWEGDVIYQSDTSMLSAVFTHSKLPVSNSYINGTIENMPCPTVAFFDFQAPTPPWEALSASTAIAIGHVAGNIGYQSSRVALSTDPPGVQIMAETDRGDPPILTGAYQTNVQLSRGGVVSLDILTAFGTRRFEDNAVTAVTFVDSENPNLVPIFEPEMLNVEFPDINAFGVQIYRNQTSQSVVLWSKSTNPLSRPIFVRQDLSHINLSISHTYSIEFRVEVPNTRQADLYVDGVQETTLQTLPVFSDDNTTIILHVFNKNGQVPEIQPTSPDPIPVVQAVFGNVHLPIRLGHLCDYGIPFFSLGSPIVEFRAGIGTRPGIVDVKDYQTIEYPCLPCGNGPCAEYGCESNCTDTDPYTIPLTFRDLNLDDGYYSDVDRSLVGSGGQLPLHLTNEIAENVLSNPLTDHFQPPVYYITVEAVTASGKRFSSSSNGVVIDTSPPELVGAIDHYDVAFSTVEPTIFQGNNDTISASWAFRDPQSGIVEYLWAIGSSPYGDDIQQPVSVGAATRATNSNLLGLLEANTTYYITVITVNGAGLRANITSGGITYIESELNITLLELIFEVEFAEVLTFLVNDTVNEVLRTVREDRASILWAGVSEDIEEIFWRIGSERLGDDVFPATQVNFNNSETATIESGVLYLDNNAFANLSEIVALADGKEEDPSDNLFFFEPGRQLYNSLEFCNFVHRCAIIGANPSILIRLKDAEFMPTVGQTESVLTHIQQFPPRVNRRLLPALDKRYTVTLRTTGLESTSALFLGFLNQSDIMNRYRVQTPYISNPFDTMAQTSREIARRFTEIGGPSFYVSFLGQDSLNAPLEINVTYDSTLDWTTAFPELGYWDVDEQVWREVSATCMNSSRVDESTFTLAVQVCSTVLTETVTRPESLARRRRQANMGMDPVTSSGMGSGTMDVSSIPVTDYLDRPVHFILMRIGNVSTNTAPELQLPVEPLEIIEDTILEYQLEFSDNEGDLVDFYLASAPKLGNATLSIDGLLTYEPCGNCTGLDVLEVYVIEQPFGESHIPLPARGQLLINITNDNDRPEVIFYAEVGSDVVSLNSTLYVYAEANRTAPAIVASIAAFDYDGYHDDISVFVRNGMYGAGGFQIWLDAVNTPESLPLTFPDNVDHNLTDFTGYITFIGAYITYLPNDPAFTGIDMIQILVGDSNGRLSSTMSLTVELLPSLCQNNGVCGGSDLDPNCTDIAVRRVMPEAYNCSCPAGFEGEYCEIEVGAPDPTPTRDCPRGIPLVQCDGDPCRNAECPSHPTAVCRADYCGACTAKWFIGQEQITCRSDSSDICFNQSPATIPFMDCSDTVCDCPTPPYQCPPDSIIVSTRISACCVLYECVCPNISCPLLMECGQGVQPIPDYRGNGFPGRCCPDYNFEDINECQENSENLCSDGCVDEPNTYSCSCPEGKTLAMDGFNCGVCPYNGYEYLIGDRVKIGCNWCICRGDELSGERWHCTADTCDRGCIRDGIFYPVGSNVSDESLICACESTDVNAEWVCSVNP